MVPLLPLLENRPSTFTEIYGCKLVEADGNVLGSYWTYVEVSGSRCKLVEAIGSKYSSSEASVEVPMEAFTKACTSFWNLWTLKGSTASMLKSC